MTLTIQTIMAVAQLLLAVGTLIIAVIAYKLTKKTSRIEAHRSIKTAFNTIDTITLSDPENLRVFEYLEFPELLECSQ